MVTVIVQHEVKDFAPWKKVFDADEPNRSKAGVKTTGLYTSVKNPNDVTVIMEAPNAETVGAMMSRPEMEETMKSAGVISAPVVSLLNKV